jgi:hypothetical protein
MMLKIKLKRFLETFSQKYETLKESILIAQGKSKLGK